MARRQFQVGAQNGVNRTGGALLKPEEEWNIDTKMDDGKPGYGKIRAHKFSSAPCATTDDPATAEYNLSVSDLVCNIKITIWE